LAPRLSFPAVMAARNNLDPRFIIFAVTYVSLQLKERAEMFLASGF
jgi:hypothetical protein